MHFAQWLLCGVELCSVYQEVLNKGNGFIQPHGGESLCSDILAAASGSDVSMLNMHPCLDRAANAGITLTIFRSCFLQRTGRAFLALLATCIISTLLSTSLNIFSTLFIAWVIQCRASQVRTPSAVCTDDQTQYSDLGDHQDIHLVWQFFFDNCETFWNMGGKYTPLP